MRQLGAHLLKAEVAEEVCITSEAILGELLKNQFDLSPSISDQIASLFSFLISASKLRAGELRGRIDSLFLAWLRNPASFGKDMQPHFALQRTGYFQRVVNLIVSGAISVSDDRASLERFLQWINNWELENKLELESSLDFLKRKHPAPGLWDIVRFYEYDSEK